MNHHVGLNDEGLTKLEELRADYERVAGEPFQTFFCPILFRDEKVELCRAHLINRAFRDSHRGWTIQRRDVDSFFGSVFEADFLSLQDRESHNPVDVLGDRHLSNLLRPSITVEDAEVDHYVSNGPVPDRHSKVLLETSEGELSLVLRMQPPELVDQVDRRWEVRIDKDVRLHALASVLKAAHLILFDLLGYAYALSPGGRFLGWTILGSFFDANCGRQRAAALEAGKQHFPAFVNMVRPILTGGDHMQGTASDGRFYVCGEESPWAVLVIVRTARDRHAVLVPVSKDPDEIAHFLAFLDSPPCEIAVRFAELKEDHIEGSSRIDRFHWPPANYQADDS